MAERRIVALIYEVHHSDGVDYLLGTSLVKETPDFEIEVANGQARFELKYIFTDVALAQKVVLPYIHLWSLESTLNRGPGEFELSYLRAEFEEPEPTNGLTGYAPSLTITRSSYPPPPDDFPNDAIARLAQTYPRIRAAVAGPVHPVPGNQLSAAGKAGDFGGTPITLQPATGIGTVAGADATKPNSILNLNVNETANAQDTFDAEVIHASLRFIPPPDWEATKRDILRRLDALEVSFRDSLPMVQAAAGIEPPLAGLPGLGHNNPPEPISSTAPFEVGAGIEAIDVIRRELATPQPANSALLAVAITAINKAYQVAIAALRLLWTAVKYGTAAFATGWLAQAGADFYKHPEKIQAVISHLEQSAPHIISTIQSWF